MGTLTAWKPAGLQNSGPYLEHGAQAGNLLGGHAAGDDLERLLLQLVHVEEAAHARQDHVVQRLVAGRAVLAHPAVAQDLISRRTLLWVLRQHHAFVSSANIGVQFTLLQPIFGSHFRMRRRSGAISGARDPLSTLVSSESRDINPCT